MESKRVINFGAGPAKLPEEVLLKIQNDLLNYNDSGISMLELSHRSADFMNLVKATEESARHLLDIPTNYKVIFLQGGGSGQFAAIPLNLMNTGSADFIVTGSWSQKAFGEAEKYGRANLVFPNTRRYSSIPNVSTWSRSDEASYLYYCDNETIHGVEFDFIPESGNVPLICDMSSNIMTKTIDISKFGLIFAGAQKNIGCAGMTLVIIREDLIGQASKYCPSIWDYKLQVEHGSLYNTPPTFSLYSINLVFDWIKDSGGVAAMEECCSKKSKLIYSVIEGSNGFYRSPVDKQYRSRMNVPFRVGLNDTGDPQLEKEFLDAARLLGMVELKGHRSVGGIRASLYNAITMEEASMLADFMTDFMQQHV